jgi:nucleoside 2-deoxyribosyltransferase
MLTVVYIAGPYRAPTAWQVQAHIRAAQEAALHVWKMGAVALCPHSNTGQFEGECPDDVWLEGDLELLRRCDAVLMIAGWEHSHGATAERLAALALGMPVFDAVYEGGLGRLHAWIEDLKRPSLTTTSATWTPSWRTVT